MKKSSLLIKILVILSILSCSTKNNNNEPELLDCGIPINILITDITADSAIISWTEDVNQINIEIEYGVSGFAIGSGNTFNSVGNSKLLENLNPSTDYDMYIKTLCGNQDSNFSNAVTFTTLCETVYSGNLTLVTQQEVDDFPQCYNEIDGTLQIGGSNSDITSLEPLSNLTIIQGDLIIRSNDMLLTLNGLQNITTVNYEFLIIENNANLINLDGLEGLTSILYNNASISFNGVLNDFCALQNLFTNESFNENYIDIAENLFNPSVQNIIDGNCSQ